MHRWGYLLSYTGIKLVFVSIDTKGQFTISSKHLLKKFWHTVANHHVFTLLVCIYRMPVCVDMFIFMVLMYHSPLSFLFCLANVVLCFLFEYAMQVVLSICSLLTDPNPHSPLNWTAAKLYRNHCAKYEETVSEWTKQYAI